MASERKEPTVLSELKNFLQFLCEGNSCSLESVITSSIIILKECPPSRDAVLEFYSQLFDDYCGEYCFTKVHALSPNDASIVNIPQIGNERPIISRFIHMTKKEIQIDSTDVSVRKVSTDSRRQSYDSGETPLSPTPVTCQSDDHSSINESDVNCSTVMASLDYQFTRINDALSGLIKIDPNFSKQITEWSLEFAAKLSTKYSIYNVFMITSLASTSKSSALNDPNASLTSLLSFWLKCPVMELLTNLSIVSTESKDIDAVIKQLLQYSPHSDWILAHLITTMSTNTGFVTYIEQLMQSAASSTSITCILSYLSEHNPRAIVNSSKSNIPFLLKLCTNSKPLLNLLAHESSKQVNMKLLNELALTHADDFNDSIIYCLLNAPNAFDMLILAFDITVNPDSSEQLKEKTLHILSLIVMQIHQFVYGPKRAFTDELPILKLLIENVKNLVIHAVKASEPSSRRLYLRLLHLICVHYGIEFVPEVIHYVLNTPLQNMDTETFRSPLSSPLLSSFLKSLKMQFGASIHSCLSNTLKLPYEKSVHFWAHLLTAVETDEFVCLDIDLLGTFINDDKTEEIDNYFCHYYVLRLLLLMMEKFPKHVSKPRYRLCHYLVCNYFNLIKLQQNSDDNKLDIYMESIVISQKCMSILSKGFSINQHILSRLLLELSLENNQLFCIKNIKKEMIDKSFSEYNLLKENSIHGTGHSSKFKKITLVSGKRGIPSKNSVVINNCYLINQQLLLDAFHCCVEDVQAFAKLLVQCVSPDLIFNDVPWPDEDPRDGQMQHLRITIERDLCIARQFEANPLLWDLCQMIGNAGHLKQCFVIIRALMAVQRTHWASTTAGKENLTDTQKLLKLLCSSGILPENPFKHIPPVLPKLQSWEVSCILSDICKYMRDTSLLSSPPPIKPYVERLRIIMASNMPGPLFVKIFKNISRK